MRTVRWATQAKLGLAEPCSRDHNALRDLSHGSPDLDFHTIAKPASAGCPAEQQGTKMFRKSLLVLKSLLALASVLALGAAFVSALL